MQMDADNLQEIEEKLQDSTVYLSVNKTAQSNPEVNDTDMQKLNETLTMMQNPD